MCKEKNVNQQQPFVQIKKIKKKKFGGIEKDGEEIKRMKKEGTNHPRP